MKKTTCSINARTLHEAKKEATKAGKHWLDTDSVDLKFLSKEKYKHVKGQSLFRFLIIEKPSSDPRVTKEPPFPL